MPTLQQTYLRLAAALDGDEVAQGTTARGDVLTSLATVACEISRAARHDQALQNLEHHLATAARDHDTTRQVLLDACDAIASLRRS